MQISFRANLETGEAEISKPTLDRLATLSPLMRADLLKDIVYDAMREYNAALVAMRDEFKEVRNKRKLP